MTDQIIFKSSLSFRSHRVDFKLLLYFIDVFMHLNGLWIFKLNKICTLALKRSESIRSFFEINTFIQQRCIKLIKSEDI